MKKEKTNKDNLSSLIAKVSAYASLILVAIIGFIIVPKEVINNNQLYTFSVGISSPSMDNAVLYDYKVFGSEKRFEEALIVEVNEKVEEFKVSEDVLMVRIYGVEHTETFKNDYWLVTDPETPELNIEYYVLSNLTFTTMSLPCHTFINLAKQIVSKVNIIYLVIIILVALGIITPFSIGVARAIPKIVKLNKENNNESQIEDLE